MINLKTFLTLCITLCAAIGYSQQDTTLVYARTGIEKDPIRSKFKKEIVKKDSLWLVNFTDKKGVRQETIGFADEGLTIRKGPYQLYAEGKLKEEGQYNRGYKVGEWTYYIADKVSLKSNYSWGKLNGSYKKYWDNGQVKEDANYVNGRKAGDRNMFYKDGKPALKEFYENGEKVTGAYFDQQGNATKEINIVQPPSFPGGMPAFYQFLSEEIRYPKEAVKNGISGTVRLSFIVMKDGRIDNIKVIDSPDEELSREAIRVLRYNIKWNPGIELGEPIDASYRVPIKFSLNR